MCFAVLSNYMRLLVLFLLFNSMLVLPVLGEFKFTAIPDQDNARLQQRFGKIADLAVPIAATNSIFHTPIYPSCLKLPVQRA